MPIAFQCRARPQDCDALEVFQETGRAFIGWPLYRQDMEYDPEALSACLVDPTCPDEEWEEHIAGRGNRNFTKNRNFVGRVTEESIVVIPRPSQGAAYVGRIAGKFEIVNAPPWGQSYLDLRRKQGLNVDDLNWHVADVAQGWPVDGYHRVDLSRMPGWLRRSLLGRSTYNELPPHPLDGNVTAHGVLDQILEGAAPSQVDWTLDPDEIKRRLVDRLNNPCAFENLVVALLQLEHPDEVWDHTGGPGDGGIDGIGSNAAGDVVAVMQAKYYAATAPGLGEFRERPLRCYAAVLLPPNPNRPTDGTCVLDLDWIARAVSRYWRRLPIARTLRVGEY